ncbi:MAG: hypothetical protein VZR53_12400 [Prevotella sp.]|nr:hypothetical protein [Prevotella sp.]
MKKEKIELMLDDTSSISPIKVIYYRILTEDKEEANKILDQKIKCLVEAYKPKHVAVNNKACYIILAFTQMDYLNKM